MLELLAMCLKAMSLGFGRQAVIISKNQWVSRPVLTGTVASTLEALWLFLRMERNRSLRYQNGVHGNECATEGAEAKSVMHQCYRIPHGWYNVTQTAA